SRDRRLPARGRRRGRAAGSARRLRWSPLHRATLGRAAAASAGHPRGIMSRSHPCPEESSVMHSTPLAPRPSGAAHPSASHPAASDPVASRPSASDPPASDPPASDSPASVPASPGGSAAAAAPARGRHDRGALAVLVLSLLQVTVEPLPDAVHAMIGSPEMAGYLLVQRSEEHTSELQSRFDLVCRLLL